MSKSALTISLLLVIVLSIVGIALLISPPPSASAGDPGSLLRLDPSLVKSVRSTPATGDPTTVITRTDSGGWEIHLERNNTAISTPWPAQPTQVRAAIRQLCDLRTNAETSRVAGAVIDPPLTIEIGLIDGPAHTIRFDRSPLGGRRLVEIDARLTGEIDDSIYRAMTNPGPAGWRVRSPLTSVGERTSRIAIGAPGQGKGIELAKLDGRWFLRQPVQSRADDHAAGTLIASIGSLTIERFIDDDANISIEETGLDQPRLSCRVEADTRSVNPDSGEVQTTTRTQTLAIGGPADLSGKLVYASINNGQTLAVINIEPIASVSLTGGHYLASAAAETIEPNIGALAVRVAGQPEARYERGIDHWRFLDATGATLGEAPTAPIQALLDTLTDTVPTSLTIEPPESYRPIASITLYDFGGGPMETIEAGVVDAGVLALRSGQVFRVYEGVEIPSLLDPNGLR